MPHRVRFDGPARVDLKNIVGWIANEAGIDIAIRYVGRIEETCAGLVDFPRRGRLRHSRSGVRSIPFHRSATILYRVGRDEVLILRILHSGRDADRESAAIAGT